MVKIIAIIAFIILGIGLVANAGESSAVGIANYTAFGGFFPNGVWGMWVGVIVSIFSYLSIEMIAIAAAEAREPERAVVAAFRATLFRLVFFYLATLALTLMIIPWTQAGNGESPFVRVMAQTGVPGAAGIFNFIILVAAISAMNSQLYVTTRMMFSLSRAGYAPVVFGHINQSGVPVNALWLSSLGIAVAVALNALLPNESFLLMMSISMFGAMFTWAGIFATHIAFRQKVDPLLLRFRMWGYPYTSFAGLTLMAAALMTTAFVAEFQLTLAYGVPFIAVLLIVYFAYIKKRLK